MSKEVDLETMEDDIIKLKKLIRVQKVVISKLDSRVKRQDTDIRNMKASIQSILSKLR